MAISKFKYVVQSDTLDLHKSVITVILRNAIMPMRQRVTHCVSHLQTDVTHKCRLLAQGHL